MRTFILVLLMFFAMVASHNMQHPEDELKWQKVIERVNDEQLISLIKDSLVLQTNIWCSDPNDCWVPLKTK